MTPRGKVLCVLTAMAVPTLWALASDGYARHLAFGWMFRLRHIAEMISWNGHAVAVGVGAFLLAMLLLHVTAVAIARQMDRDWRIGWTFTLALAVGVLFAAGLMGAGLYQSIVWVAGDLSISAADW